MLRIVVSSISFAAALALGTGCAAAAEPKTKAKLTVLYSFKGGTDGATPYSTLIMDANGNFYGTTVAGGSANLGTVFMINKRGVEKVLHSFTGGNDGARPYSGLAQDSNGIFYGVTYNGGSPGLGTVYKITRSGAESILHVFQGIYNNNDGSFPYGAPIIASDGLLYGTTVDGGGPSNEGSLYVFSPTLGFGGVLYGFTEATGDATHPYSSLTEIQDEGVAYLFGAGAFGGYMSNNGSVFGFDYMPPWEYVFAGDFPRASSGQYPMASPVFDSSLVGWGATSAGGDNGLGVVYSTYLGYGNTTDYSFKGIYNASDGSFPYAALVIGSDGILYGTTLKGGNSTDNGTIYTFTRSPSYGETPIYRFSGPDGSHPYGALLEATPGTFYGTTSSGGANNLGVVYKLVVK